MVAARLNTLGLAHLEHYSSGGEENDDCTTNARGAGDADDRFADYFACPNSGSGADTTGTGASADSGDHACNPNARPNSEPGPGLFKRATILSQRDCSLRANQRAAARLDEHAEDRPADSGRQADAEPG